MKLNISMQFGPNPEDVHAIGTKAEQMDTQEYAGQSSGSLLYVQFANGVRSWVHEKYFDKE